MKQKLSKNSDLSIPDQVVPPVVVHVLELVYIYEVVMMSAIYFYLLLSTRSLPDIKRVKKNTSRGHC